MCCTAQYGDMYYYNICPLYVFLDDITFLQKDFFLLNLKYPPGIHWNGSDRAFIFLSLR